METDKLDNLDEEYTKWLQTASSTLPPTTFQKTLYFSCLLSTDSFTLSFFFFGGGGGEAFQTGKSLLDPGRIGFQPLKPHFLES